jgi:hypothetical protein
VVLIYVEQTGFGQGILFALKRDWIRGLIFSNARSDLKLFSGTIGPRLLDVRSQSSTRKKTAMKHKPLSEKIYNVSIGVMIASFVMFLFVTGSVPFNLSVGWSDNGFGSSLVLLQNDATVELGKTVAGVADVQGKVNMYTVRDTLRREGVLYYQIDRGDRLIQAGNYTYGVLGSVPVVGIWPQTLNHPIGLMALIGAPLVMFVINMAIILTKRIAPVVSLLETQAQYGAYTSEQKTARKGTASEKRSDTNPVGVLRPFGQEYSM